MCDPQGDPQGDALALGWQKRGVSCGKYTNKENDAPGKAPKRAGPAAPHLTLEGIDPANVHPAAAGQRRDTLLIACMDAITFTDSVDVMRCLDAARAGAASAPDVTWGRAGVQERLQACRDTPMAGKLFPLCGR